MSLVAWDIGRRDQLVKMLQRVVLSDDRVESVELFGGLSRGDCDQFSDIDMQVHLHPGASDRELFEDLPAIVGAVGGGTVDGWSFSALASGMYGASFMFDDYPLFWSADIGCLGEQVDGEPTELLSTYRWEQIYSVWLGALKAAARAEEALGKVSDLVARHAPIESVATAPVWLGRARAVLDAIEQRKIARGDPYEDLHDRCVDLLETLAPVD
jgi:hypothetical protein